MGNAGQHVGEHDTGDEPRPPRMMTMDEVADALGVSVRTVIRAINANQLVATRIGRATRISVADLRAFVGARRDLSPMTRPRRR